MYTLLKNMHVSEILNISILKIFNILKAGHRCIKHFFLVQEIWDSFGQET